MSIIYGLLMGGILILVGIKGWKIPWWTLGDSDHPVVKTIFRILVVVMGVLIICLGIGSYFNLF